MRKITIITTIILLTLVPLSNIVVSVEGPNYMGFNTADPHITVTDSFITTVWVNAVSQINTAAIDNLTFLPAGRLHYTSTEKGNLFPGTLNWKTPEKNGIIDNTSGYAKPIKWVSTGSVNHNKTLANITWYANSCGMVTLTITEGGTAYGGIVGTTKLPYTIYVHPKAPTGLSAVVNGNQINLTWTKQTGMDKTLIRWRTDKPPENVTDGNFLYNDTGASAPPQPVPNPGEYIYYSAWGWNDTGLYSLNYATTLGGNLPPNIPTLVSPSDGATGIGLSPSLTVSVSDPEGDTMTVTFYDDSDDSVIGTKTGVASGSSTSVTWSGRAYSTTYSWYAIASDAFGSSPQSSTWSFTTAADTPPYNPPPYNPPPYTPPSAPTADANGPYYEPLEDGVAEVTFNGSGSSGSITSYSWDFGDNTTGTGVSPTHGYTALGNFTVNLTVTGPGGSDIDQTFAIISEEPNLPPTAPVVSGLQAGSKNTDYNYTAVSTDEDNDTLQYIFDWGDGTNSTSDFAANATAVTQMHNWSTWGIYTIKVNASDNKTYSGTTEYVVLIDVLYVKNIGYLIDTNSNGTYDKFYSNETAEQTSVEKLANGSYLINSDTDSEWDWIYDPPADNLSPYVPPSEPEKEEDYTLWYYALMILLIIILLIIAAAMKKKKKPKKKPEKPKK